MIDTGFKAEKLIPMIIISTNVTLDHVFSVIRGHWRWIICTQLTGKRRTSITWCLILPIYLVVIHVVVHLIAATVAQIWFPLFEPIALLTRELMVFRLDQIQCLLNIEHMLAVTLVLVQQVEHVRAYKPHRHHLTLHMGQLHLQRLIYLFLLHRLVHRMLRLIFNVFVYGGPIILRQDIAFVVQS